MSPEDQAELDRTELERLREWRTNITAACRRPGGLLYADVESYIRKCRWELDQLREHGATVCDGFDTGIFARDSTQDDNPSWGVKLLPYLMALSRLQRLTKGDTA